MKTVPLALALFSLLTAGCYGPKSETERQGKGPPTVSSPMTRSSPDALSSSNQASEKASNCDPNYSPCVPIASDVDCAGGGGNGPAYVRGPIRVIGTDIYGLDRDGNGIACEK